MTWFHLEDGGRKFLLYVITSDKLIQSLIFNYAVNTVMDEISNCVQFELLFWNSPGKAKENREESPLGQFVTQQTAVLLNTNHICYDCFNHARHHHQCPLFFNAEDGDSSSQTQLLSYQTSWYHMTEESNFQSKCSKIL